MKMFLDLTDGLPFKIDLEALKQDLKLLDQEKWIGHYDVQLADGWTTIPLVSHDGTSDRIESQRLGTWGQYRRTEYAEKLPAFKALLDKFDCPHGRIRIMKLMPGSIIKAHRDTYAEVSDYAFGQVRLHIPIVTNPDVRFVVAGKDIRMNEGRLYYVNFSKVHHVENNGDEPRTHLVLDLKLNEFLRGVFPKDTAWGVICSACTRALYPSFLWLPLRLKTRIITIFWKYYNDSIFQRFKKNIFR
ncbi:aspartyl/asparaginyl beta-hydroxylase domain-containing protein [Simiduia aestuariiviva]|uniref:Aspartyl/asparaginy/proline hydroxylase domain-containing protein n=1 Tax=Simiduia aestuariiviva TaxID=1510459 RepID=A0A839UQM5_9GAMM|nr:aspartyl/asparaginyl beta-hydroxylase domain-containing protein [Simiduia aestuariiviva]MBB3170083.1 hypothetical protein [Simiduia aestuariiviva]